MGCVGLGGAVVFRVGFRGVAELRIRFAGQWCSG